MMTELIGQLELKNITIVGQDWGGPISLRYAIENKNNIAAIILLNTFIERFPANQKERKDNNIINGPLPKVYEILFKNGNLSGLNGKMEIPQKRWAQVFGDLLIHVLWKIIYCLIVNLKTDPQFQHSQSLYLITKSILTPIILIKLKMRLSNGISPAWLFSQMVIWHGNQMKVKKLLIFY